MTPCFQHTHYYSRNTLLQLHLFQRLNHVTMPKGNHQTCLSHVIWHISQSFLHLDCPIVQSTSSSITVQIVRNCPKKQKTVISILTPDIQLLFTKKELYLNLGQKQHKTTWSKVDTDQCKIYHQQTGNSTQPYQWWSTPNNCHLQDLAGWHCGPCAGHLVPIVSRYITDPDRTRR